jgi:hypothetical protein
VATCLHHGPPGVRSSRTNRSRHICSYQSHVDIMLTYHPVQERQNPNMPHTQQLHIHPNRGLNRAPGRLVRSLVLVPCLMVATRVAGEAFYTVRCRLPHLPHGDAVLIQVVPVQTGTRLGMRQLRASIRHVAAGLALDLENVRTTPVV